MLLDYQLSQTSVILRVKIRQDTTGAAPGKGMTGLTFSSTGLVISTIADNEASPTVYTSAGSTIETITTLGTYAAPTATKCRFKEIQATDHPGCYEIQIADARFAVSSSKSLLISLSGVSGMMDTDVVIPLRSVNPYSANNFMTGINGQTYPAAVPGAANGLTIAGSNAATTFAGLTLAGANAVTSTPATSGLTITGGAASTTGGGTAAPAILVTGGAGAASTNGAGEGITVVGGGTTTVAGANGVSFTGTGNLHGVSFAGAGSGYGFLTTGGSAGGGAKFQGGASGNGIDIGTASGHGISIVTIGNSHAISAVASGTGSGIYAKGGGGATGDGCTFVAISSAGNGLSCSGAGTGNGIYGIGGSSASGDGAHFVGGAAGGGAVGIRAVGGATGGDGMVITATANTFNGLTITGKGTGSGISVTGGNAVSTSPAGHALLLAGGNANTTAGGVAGNAINATGGAGAATTNGAGEGITVVGGGTTTVAGANAISFTGTGSAAGILAGSVTVSGATTFTGAVTATNAGNDIRGVKLAATGLAAVTAWTVDITGSLSGSVGSVTGDVGGKVLGGGAGVLAGVGVQADLQTIKTQTVTCGAGVTVNANVGTTQPVNFTGTGASAFVKCDVENIAAQSVSLNAGGLLKVAVSAWLDTTVVTPAVAGVPDINVKNWGGTATFGSIPPDAAFIRSGTAAGGGTSTITLDAGASTTNNLYQNQVVVITSGTGAGQSALISSYDGGTKIATINGAWATAPNATSKFVLIGFGAISASVSGNVTVGAYAAGQDPGTYVLATPANKLATDASGRIDVGKILGTASAGTAGYVGLDWGHINAPTTTVDLSGTTVKNLDNAPPGTLTLAQIATAVLTDTTSSDFTVVGSPGHILVTQLGGTFTTTASSIFTSAALANAPSSGGVPQTGDVYSFITSALAESYAANGSTATMAQLLYMIYSAVQNFSIAGTTLTEYRLDHASTAMTVTLNDATNPTSRVRSS